jgi:hypothetical protein
MRAWSWWWTLAACGPGSASIAEGPPSSMGLTHTGSPTETGAPPTSVDPTGDTAADETTGDDDCPPVTDATRAVVITDIDETLTTSDAEWLAQIALGTEPEMRPEADALMRLFVQRGYRVIYVSARGEDLGLLDGRSAREATEGWLADHGFPYTSDGVFLAPGLAAFPSEAADYKTEVLGELQALGVDMRFAYGNADTDIEAYQNVGIPDDRIFLVGKLAGQMGVEPIPTSEAYGAHLPIAEQYVPCADAP